MSNPCLPAEILDHIVDLLHDTEYALMNCCLVSQSWIPRTRKQLFVDIDFFAAENLQSWKDTFPDPSTSPARYTKTLFIGCPQVVTAADAEEGGWIRTFSRVLRLEVNGGDWTDVDEPEVPLAPFHGFSPVVKSLRLGCLTIPPSQIANLILSFPLLEDLTVVALDIPIDDNDDVPDGLATVVHSSNPPTFTGSLVLHLEGGMNPITRRLLSLPSGLHFRKLDLKWTHKKDVLLTMALVERCCSTLESLKIDFEPFAEPRSGLIDLSKATKLKDAVFTCGLNPQWVVMALRTVTPDHRNLQQISLDASHTTLRLRNFNRVDPANIGDAIGETVYSEWLELDHLLVQLWESHLIHLKVLYNSPKWADRKRARSFVESLLPEVTTRGAVDLIGQRFRW